MQPRATLTIGDIAVTIVSGGPFRLDGGGMFGIVPKPLWERTNPADERNRIALETNCAILEVSGRRALIDTGNGTKLSEKDRDIFALDPEQTLVGALASATVAPDQIDVVILTHLHLDHVGGAVLRTPEGELRPTFPRARHVVQRGEWEDALANRSTMHTSYRPENLLPLEEAGLVDLLDDDTEILPGVRARVTGGHTRRHQMIELSSGGQRAVYPGDILPTRSHLRAPYNMAFDLAPYETMQQKLALLEQAAREEWLILFDHEPGPPVARVRSDGKGGYVPYE